MVVSPPIFGPIDLNGIPVACIILSMIRWWALWSHLQKDFGNYPGLMTQLTTLGSMALQWLRLTEK